MKKRVPSKWSAAFVILMILFACLFACDEKPQNKEPENISENTSESSSESPGNPSSDGGVNAGFPEYSLKYENGKQYLKIFNHKAPSAIGDRAAPKLPTGKSIQEIAQKIKNGLLTHYELQTSIIYSEQNENGMEIFNLENPYTPVFPKNFFIRDVSWNGQCYGYRIADENNSGTTLVIMSKSVSNIYPQLLPGKIDENISFAKSAEDGANVEKYCLTSGGTRKLLVKNTLENAVIQKIYTLENDFPEGEENFEIDLPQPETAPDKVYFHREYEDYVLEFVASGTFYDNYFGKHSDDYYLEFGLTR